MKLGIGILGAPADEAEDFLPISRKTLPDFLCRIDVGRAIRRRWVGAEKRDDADKNRLNSMNR